MKKIKQMSKNKRNIIIMFVVLAVFAIFRMRIYASEDLDLSNGNDYVDDANGIEYNNGILTLDNSYIDGDLILPSGMDILIDCSGSPEITGSIIMPGSGHTLTIRATDSSVYVDQTINVNGNSLVFSDAYAYVNGEIQSSVSLTISDNSYLSVLQNVSIGNASATTGSFRILDSSAFLSNGTVKAGKFEITGDSATLDIDGGAILSGNSNGFANVANGNKKNELGFNNGYYTFLSTSNGTVVTILTLKKGTTATPGDIGGTPVETTFTIKATAGANGTISNAGDKEYNQGESATYYITPNPGYKVKNVLVNGSSVGAVTSYTFSNIDSNATISVEFEIIKYSVTVTKGGNGTVSNEGTTKYDKGSNITLTFEPDGGNQIQSVIVNGENKGSISSFDINNIDKDYTVIVTFEHIYHKVTVVNGNNGQVSASVTIPNNKIIDVASGNEIKFIFKPDEGYRVKNVKIDGVQVETEKTNTVEEYYTLENINKDCTVSVEYELAYYGVKVTKAENGKIEPADATSYYASNPGINETEYLCKIDKNMTFKITPNTGYKVKSVKVNNVEKGEISSYTFSNISKLTNTLIAEFEKIEELPPESGEEGNQGSQGENQGETGSGSGTGEITNPGEGTGSENEGNTGIGSEGETESGNTESGNESGSNIGTGTENENGAGSGSNTPGENNGSQVIVEEKTYTITATSDKNGKITQEGNSKIEEGGNVTYTFIPNPGYKIKNVIVDGVNKGSISTYVFENVNTEHSINVEFEKIDVVVPSTDDEGNGNANVPPVVEEKVEGEEIVKTGDIFTTCLIVIGGIFATNIFIKRRNKR